MKKISSGMTRFNKKVFPAIWFGFLVKQLVWDLVDEVYDYRDYLLIKNRGESERVPLTNVMNVSATTFSNPPRITLRLVKKGKFGNEIAFQPAGFSLNPFAKSPIAEDLMVPVDEARPRR